MKRYEDFITSHGAVATRSIAEADIILIDTCAFNKERERISLELIAREQRRARAEARIIVCGCLAGINPQVLQQTFRGHFFSPKDEAQLAVILGVEGEEDRFLTPSDVRGRHLGDEDFFTGGSEYSRWLVRVGSLLHRIDHHLPLDRVPVIGKLLSSSQGINRHAYAITISQGCLGNCSFCVIPNAKGRTRSLSVGMIVDRVRQVAEQGTRHIALVSEDTGAYGCDIGTNLMDLLEKIHEIPADLKLHTPWFDPRWLDRYFRELMHFFALGKIVYFQAPLQSASSTVLARMRRAYQAEAVLPLLREIRRAHPSLAIGSQFIAGFPGETEEEFEATRALLTEYLFDHVYVFEFSNRPGAETEKMQDHLPPPLIEARAAKLRRTWRTTRVKALFGYRSHPCYDNGREITSLD